MRVLFRISISPLACVAALLSPVVEAAETAPMQAVVVTGSKVGLLGIADSATEGSVSAPQLATRPLLRAAEVLESVPGMIVTQHSGDGKANQYFLRGFNLDHGTDFSTRLMGVPVNIPAHAHGQGYMDLNFLIPELISKIRYRKGMYAAEDGDFANTGSARIDYVRRLDAPLLDLTLGAHGFRRALLAGGTALHSGNVLGALEVAGNNGPWEQAERLHKVNGVLCWSGGGYAITAMAYRTRWLATEHVPERAIDSGAPDSIGRFGALSRNDGGRTHRYSLAGEWSRQASDGAAHLSVYAIDYGLQLYSAPSGFMNGPAGDQHEQAEQRHTFGGEARRKWRFGRHDVALGLQLRQDQVANIGLYDTVDRVRTGTVRQDRLRETGVGLFGELHTEWQPYLRSTVGLREDVIDARVTPTGGRYNAGNGGALRASQISPKLNVVLADPAGRRELYANWGYGFHSNDVRGATTNVNPHNADPVARLDLFSRAVGAELGLRTQLLPGWTSTLSVWRMTLASELVFVGDEGITEAQGGSRRHGVEWSNFITPVPGVTIDADLAYAHARFRENVDGAGRHVPNAVPLTAALGVSADRGGAWFGGLHVRYVGAYPLVESGREKSASLLTANLKISYRSRPRWQFSFDVLNLLNRRGNDIEYWGASCTRVEQANGICGTGIMGRLVHPLESRSARVSVRSLF